LAAIWHNHYEVREQIIIDGNNLWHAMRVHAPLPPVGRETLVKLIDQWAGQVGAEVMIVFDGPTPREGLAQQMATRRVNVRFSAPQTADDVIERLLKKVRDPAVVRVITSDNAVRSDATHRRCRHTDSVRFVGELFPADGKKRTSQPSSTPRPPSKTGSGDSKEVPSGDTEEWIRLFGAEELRLPEEWSEWDR